MKKLVATAAVAAVLGSVAFADVNIGSWVSGVWGFGNGKSNYDSEKNDFYTANTQSWGGNGPRTAIDATGSTDYIGFQLQIFGNGTDLGMGDNAKIWWTPIEQFRLQLGHISDDTLRSDAVYGMWDTYRLGAVRKGFDGTADGEDIGLISNREEEGWTFMGQGTDGSVLSVSPIEGLQFFASLGFPFGDAGTTTETTYYSDEDCKNKLNTVIVDGKYYNSNSKSWEKAYTKKSVVAGDNPSVNLAEVFGRKSKYAMAYTIEGIGTVKVGLDTTPARVTDKDGKAKDQNIINAAFDLSAVENLKVSIGAFIPTVQKITAFEMAVGNLVNASAKYNMDALTISARVGTVIGTAYENKDGELKKDGGFGFLVGGGIDFDVMESITVFGEADYANGIYYSRSETDYSDVFDFGIGVRKSYDGGSVSVAFEGATNNNGMFACAKADDFAWCVPIVIRQSF